MKVLPTANANTTFNLFYSHKTDLILDTRSIPSTLVADIKDKPYFHANPFGATTFLRFNVKRKPFDDVRVRKAFNFGIDQGKLLQSILLGTGEPAKSVLPPSVADYDPSFFEYGFDPAKGKALLAEAGFPDGLSTDLIFSDVSWWEEQVAVQVADQLKSIGVTATPRHITATEMNARGAPAKQDMPFFTYEDGPIVLDSIYTLALLADSKGVSNRTRYSNPKLDALVLKGRTTLDPAVKHDVAEQAQKIWMDDAPWVMTCYPQLFEAMGPNISGWVSYPDERVRWVDLRSA
jgi:ABC-type transport system substrate-binding protein